VNQPRNSIAKQEDLTRDMESVATTSKTTAVSAKRKYNEVELRAIRAKELRRLKRNQADNLNKCEECGKKFTRKDNLAMHKRRNHLESKKQESKHLTGPNNN